MEEASRFVCVGVCVFQDPEQDPGFLVLMPHNILLPLTQQSSRYIKTISEAPPPFTDCRLSMVQSTV